MKWYVIRNDPDSGQRLTVNQEELRFWEGRAILNADGSQYGRWVKDSGPYDEPEHAMDQCCDKEAIQRIHNYV